MQVFSQWAAGLLLGFAVQAASGATKPVTLYSFNGGADGATPVAGLVANGTLLYGTTQFGGVPDNDTTDGTIFQVDMNTHVETVLYRFKGNTTDTEDGANPVASLVYSPAGSGVLYGTTQYGGFGFGTCLNGQACGTVFAFDLGTNTETVLYRFMGGADGANPTSPLLLVNGILFGTTPTDGKFHCAPMCGTIFQLDPNTQTETVLHTFMGGTDGRAPGNLLLSGNTLYGTTTFGGTAAYGTVFGIDTTGNNYTLLHYFKGGKDGANPAGSLQLYKGSLFGTTEAGGTSGLGTLFTVVPTNMKYKVENDFAGTNGSMPLGGLTMVSANSGPSLHRGIVYGPTVAGGGPPNATTADAGTIFSFNLKKKTETVLYSFSGGADGGAPVGAVLPLGSALYGTTSTGGTSGMGTVFELVP